MRVQARLLALSPTYPELTPNRPQALTQGPSHGRMTQLILQLSG